MCIIARVRAGPVPPPTRAAVIVAKALSFQSVIVSAKAVVCNAAMMRKAGKAILKMHPAAESRWELRLSRFMEDHSFLKFSSGTRGGAVTPNVPDNRPDTSGWSPLVEGPRSSGRIDGELIQRQISMTYCVFLGAVCFTAFSASSNEISFPCPST